MRPFKVTVRVRGLDAQRNIKELCIRSYGGSLCQQTQGLHTRFGLEITPPPFPLGNVPKLRNTKTMQQFI